MILLIHKDNKIIEIRNKPTTFKVNNNENIPQVLKRISNEFPDKLVGWLHNDLIKFANPIEWPKLINNQKEILSFTPPGKHYLTSDLEFTEFFSPYFINKKNFNVKYATWLISSLAGIAYAKIFSFFESENPTKEFDAYLNDFSKIFHKKGLFFYHEPKLIDNTPPSQLKHPIIKRKSFFSFLKTHYGRKFIFHYLGITAFHKKTNFLDLLKNLYLAATAKKYKIHIDKKFYDFLYGVQEKLTKNLSNVQDSIDVIIPTLGRQEYLYNILSDLKNQKLTPVNVIIIEQIKKKDTEDLSFIKKEKWPFNVIHLNIQKIGACNARNLGIKYVSSNYVFFADDDIRIQPNTLEEALKILKSHSLSALTLAVYLKGEPIKPKKIPVMWETFGSGCSIVEAKFVKDTNFDLALEFGYGEDKDYGNKLRNKGCSIFYYDANPILHLKAPSGGFRFKFNLPWEKEKIKPKPSPTIMYFMKQHLTNKQITGYKFFLFYKQVLVHKPVNIFKFINTLNKQWAKSNEWADRLYESNTQR